MRLVRRQPQLADAIRHGQHVVYRHEHRHNNPSDYGREVSPIGNCGAAAKSVKG